MTAPRTVIRVTAKALHVPMSEIRSRSRHRHTAFTRQVAMWFLSDRYGMSPGDVATVMERDRTTVQQGIQKIARMIGESEPHTLAAVRDIALTLDGLDGAA